MLYPSQVAMGLAAGKWSLCANDPFYGSGKTVVRAGWSWLIKSISNGTPSYPAL